MYGTLDTIMSITRDDVLTYIKRNFAKDNIVISVAGCTKKEEIITLLDKYLSKLPSKRSKVRKIPVKIILVLQKVRIFLWIYHRV